MLFKKKDDKYDLYKEIVIIFGVDIVIYKKNEQHCCSFFLNFDYLVFLRPELICSISVTLSKP